jgi:uncharacterized protein (TIGR02118 family)
MIKIMILVKRKKGISRKDFYAYWEKTHGPLIAKNMPGIRKYVQNHFVEAPGTEYEGDGIIEVWFDNLEAYNKFMEFQRSPEARKLGLGEDWAKIADMSPPKVWIVTEHLIKDFD